MDEVVGDKKVCLYCGEELKLDYDEYHPYYECNCDDAKLEREIKEKIDGLKKKLPIEKFRLESKTHLVAA